MIKLKHIDYKKIIEDYHYPYVTLSVSEDYWYITYEIKIGYRDKENGDVKTYIHWNSIGEKANIFVSIKKDNIYYEYSAEFDSNVMLKQLNELLDAWHFDLPYESKKYKSRVKIGIELLNNVIKNYEIEPYDSGWWYMSDFYLEGGYYVGDYTKEVGKTKFKAGDLIKCKKDGKWFYGLVDDHDYNTYHEWCNFRFYHSVYRCYYLGEIDENVVAFFGANKNDCQSCTYEELPKDQKEAYKKMLQKVHM